MHKYLIKRVGNGFTANCICLDSGIQAYALINNEKTYAPGTVFNFNYTGTVQEVELLQGKYKLQCWGAQGGNSGSYSGIGSKGGYSEGILTIDNLTIVYIFVGGKGANGTNSTSVANGGWNGGGGSVGKSSYDSDNTYGISYPACGGGATDISTITSDMSYIDGRTNRSNNSLLSRCIVAGGGAGGSARYTEETTIIDGGDFTEEVYNGYPNYTLVDGDPRDWYLASVRFNIYAGSTYHVVINGNINNSVTYGFTEGVVVTADATGVVQIAKSLAQGGDSDTQLIVTRDYHKDSQTQTSTSDSKSNSSQQGGGTSGRGTSPGTQTSGGGEFGLGKNQTATNYRYASGAGGGGWYGGGSSYSDSDTSNINYSGGGSGFVNIAANASSRPSGYTGLQLDSGFTKAGNVSFPSPNGGNETGHSGNGYVRITVLNPDGSDPGGGSSGTTASVTWQTKSGTWNESSNSSAADSKQFTCESPGSSGSTVLRCTFSGISSIKFKCRYQGEDNYDYLTVGSIDTTCSRSSYGTSLKGTSGTWKEITYTCDSCEHFVEFCYSKDGSVDTSPDNAEVYILEYT